MNCIIVDDNKLARTALGHLISQVDFLKLKKECATAPEAVNILKQEQIDLVFLDVEMPGMSGLELLKHLDPRPIVILITAKKDYALEAFELNVADYIVKPVTLPRFMASVARAKELFDSKNGKIEVAGKDLEYIFVRNKSAITKIKLSDILYIQALGDYVNIFTCDKLHTVHITLSGMEQKLPADKFYRIHRSYIIALDQVETIDDNRAHIGKHAIPIGEQYKQPLLQKLHYI